MTYNEYFYIGLEREDLLKLVNNDAAAHELGTEVFHNMDVNKDSKLSDEEIQ